MTILAMTILTPSLIVHKPDNFVSLLCGGPKPPDAGRLNMMGYVLIWAFAPSIHRGSNLFLT
jgi:hypothetical protein